MYVVVETEPGVYTVGFFTPSSAWNACGDFDTEEAAVNRMRFLNGAPDAAAPKRAKTPAAPITTKPK